MKILFVYERFILPTVGGVERVTSLLAAEFTRRGHDVTFLSVGPREWNSGEIPDVGFPQYYIASSEPDFSDRIVDFARKEGFDAAIFQGYHQSVVRAMRAMPEGIRKLLAYHNRPHSIIPNERFVKRLTPWRSLRLKGKALKALALVAPGAFRRLIARKNASLFRSIVRDADRLVLLSEKFLPHLLKYTPGLDASKIIAINNPITFSVPEQRLEAEKENIVLFVGRLSNPQKNVTGFIDVWKEFEKTNPGWRAVVLGDGEDRQYIEDYARRRKVKNLTFEGSVADVASFYRRSKILCLTSTYEGWGMVLVEAMAYGCVPLLYDSYESASDLVTDGVNGYLIPPFNVKEMAAAMSRLAADEGLRLKMARNGERKIEEFTPSRIAEQWEKALQ